MNSYEDSGARLYSKPDSEEYLENYEKIFGEKIPWYVRRDIERQALLKAKLEERRKTCEENDTYILSD